MLVTSSSKARRDVLLCGVVWCGGWLLSRWFSGGGDWERVEGRNLGDNETGESRRHCLSGSNQRAGVWLTGCTLSRTGEEV